MATNWSALDRRHADAVHALIGAIEEADRSANRTTREEIETYFGTSHAWRAQGAWCGDELVAFGLARTPVRNGGEQPVTISGGVAPRWRAHGLGRELLERQLAAARALADELGLRTALVQMYVDSSQGALFDMAARLGFRSSSQYIQMRRSLAIPSAITAPSRFIRVLTLTSDWVKDTRKAHNRVLADNTAYSKMTGTAWQERLESMEEDWCLVAIDLFGDRPRLAGYLLASRFASNANTTRGVDGEPECDEGYVEEIVVLPQWRGKHVSSALLTTAMDRFRAAGLSYIGLDVNIDYTSDDPELLTVFEHFDFTRVGETYIVTTTV